MKLSAKQFQVLNYRNIDDSGWIPLERVTAFVGRNESGKTALLKALHKFNPAVDEPYNAQREFPRDRYTAEYRSGGEESPVCRVEFEISAEFREELRDRLDESEIPQRAVLTRFYDGRFEFEYDPVVTDDPVVADELVTALNTFAKEVGRIPDQEGDVMQKLRTDLLNWADEIKGAAKAQPDLRTDSGIGLLARVRDESNGRTRPECADCIEPLQAVLDELRDRANVAPLRQRLNEAIEEELPVFVYFENYGILDSAVYLPRFLNDLADKPSEPRVRTIDAMFKHVGLTAQEVSDLGAEEAGAAGQPATPDRIEQDQEKKELRSIKLNSASIDISKKFNEWFGQRRHKIRYQADGSYFRIWVSDDRRPDVDIELESRSKGFQWFFSFYLVFLVESDQGHKDAILLLDEPGLHLHPTAQQELLAFFERLSKNNPLVYTTHSPFLVNGEHIHRVRPVTEDETGHSRISVDGWPSDRETIFPLQAAAGYAMVRGLFAHRKNVLVEGMSDYLYLHALNIHCHALDRQGLPDDIYITPCGGAKQIGYIASLFLGQDVRPVVLLDGDDAGRARRGALMKELYAGREEAVLMLSDVLGQEDCEIEDIIGEAAILPALSELVELGVTLELDQADRSNGRLASQVVSAAKRLGIELPDAWKPEVARRIVVGWSTTDPTGVAVETLDRAETLFKELAQRFGRMEQ